MAVPIKFRRPAPRMSTDPGRQSRNSAPLALRESAIGTVGYVDNRSALPEGTPAWARWEQGELLVEVEISEGDRISARLGCSGSLDFGQQVALVFPNGEPNDAIIVAILNSSLEPAPASVAGVSTGAGPATEKGVRLPGATWQFVRLDDGRMLGIQTNDQDINIWAGAGIHLKATSGVIHLDGTVALGVPPTTPPLGSTVAPGGEEIPGVPSVPAVSVPYAPPAPSGAAPVAYVGLADGLVRAHDAYESGIAVDPIFWAWIAAVDAVARGVNPALPPAPIKLTSAIAGTNGVGSKHWATGDFEPAP